MKCLNSIILLKQLATASSCMERVGHVMIHGRNSMLAAAGECVGICTTILYCKYAADAHQQLCKLYVRHKTVSVKQE